MPKNLFGILESSESFIGCALANRKFDSKEISSVFLQETKKIKPKINKYFFTVFIFKIQFKY